MCSTVGRTMKYTELKKYIQDGGCGAFLLQGDDAYFLSHAEDMIKSAFLNLPELNFSTFEGESLKGAQTEKLVNALSAFPFMAEKRVIKVTEYYPSEVDFERYLKPLFADFPPTAVLIIVNTQSKKGVADLKRKSGISYVDCNKVDEEQVARWIFVTLKRGGVQADSSLCVSIARWCLCNMSRVSIEVEKILIYKGGSGRLSEEEAEELVYKDADYRIYEMTNAVAAKNYARFMQAAKELTSRGMDEISVLNSLFSYLRNIVTAATFRGSDAELAKILGMKEYGVKRSREQASAMGVERAQALASNIYTAIADVKCGLLTPDSAYKMVCSQIFFAV